MCIRDRLKDGRVLASGALEDVLTTARIRELYGVEAEVVRHGRSGLLVVPLAATGPEDRS